MARIKLKRAIFVGLAGFAVLLAVVALVAHQRWAASWDRQMAYHAASHGDVTTLQRYLDGGMSPDMGVHVEPDELHWLDHRIEYDAEAEKIRTPLIVGAAYGQSTNAVTLLLDRGADVNLVGPAGDTALSVATGDGNLDMVRLLVDHGADPYICWKDGSVPESKDHAINAELERARKLWNARGVSQAHGGKHPS